MAFRRRAKSADMDTVSVIWITNMAAPYRIPVWKHLQNWVVLEVALLESKSSLTADVHANRGSDWIPTDDGIVMCEIPTLKLKRGEARYYFPKRLSSALLPQKHDVVVFGGWESPIYWLLLLIAKVSGKKCVAFYESTLATIRHRRGPISWTRRLFFKAMDSIVVPGPAAWEAVLSLGIPAHKIFQGFNAVDVRKFQAATNSGISNGTGGHAFLFVGQLISRKRVEEIIDAYESIAAPLDTLTIVGTGDLADVVRRRTAANDNIRLISHVRNDEMPDLMANHNTLVLASVEEVWGLVINEALATGLHVVVSRNCGVVPSIKQMDGVFISEPHLGDLAAQMAESRRSWAGPIADPEILKYTPAEFAGVFSEAILRSVEPGRLARGSRGRKGAVL